MKTSKWLKTMRNKYDISQKKLSEETGINKYTIENIEQEKRKGSEETWKIIEDYFKNKDSQDISYSADCEDLINELKEDIEEFGEEHQCILIYKIIDNNFIFTNYDFIVDEMPFEPEKELEKDEQYIETNLKNALMIFEQQNKMF